MWSLYKLVQNASYATTLDSQVGTFGATCAACVDASLARSWSRRLMEPSWSFAIPQCHSVSWSQSAVGVMVIPQCFGSAVFWGCHDGRFKICCRIWLELGWWCSKLEKLEVILLHFAYLGLGRVKVSRFDFEKILVKMRYRDTSVVRFSGLSLRHGGGSLLTPGVAGCGEQTKAKMAGCRCHCTGSLMSWYRSHWRASYWPRQRLRHLRPFKVQKSKRHANDANQYTSIQINTNHAIQLLNHSYLILKNNKEHSARESSTQEGCGWHDLAGDALNTFEEHSQRSISRDAWQGWWGGQISRNDYKHELDWIRKAVRCAARPRFKQGYAIRNGVEIAVQVKAYSGNPMQG